jgi:hypothetical protein
MQGTFRNKYTMSVVPSHVGTRIRDANTRKISGNRLQAPQASAIIADFG